MLSVDREWMGPGVGRSGRPCRWLPWAPRGAVTASIADDMAASCVTWQVPECRSDPSGSLQAWPGVRRAGRPRQSPALTPGQRPAQRAALFPPANCTLIARSFTLVNGPLMARRFGHVEGRPSASRSDVSQVRRAKFRAASRRVSPVGDTCSCCQDGEGARSLEGEGHDRRD